MDLYNGGMDEPLATHFAYILSQEPFLLTHEDIAKADSYEDHGIFHAYQSCVWQPVRLKLPSPCGETGWRVEFRPMEVQPRDSENAAFAIFMFLLSRAILTFDISLYIPIEKVAESMKTAERHNAVRSERFWFRKFDWSSGSYVTCPHSASKSFTNPYELMSVHEIINGENAKENTEESLFPGLIAIVRAYLKRIQVSPTQEVQLSRYLDIVSQRASGQLSTPANWMRMFVKQHPEYQRDSKVIQSVCCDLLNEIILMSNQ